MLRILLHHLLHLQTILILLDQSLLDILVRFDFQELNNQVPSNHYDYHIFEMPNRQHPQLRYRKLLVELNQHKNHC